jgi:hypothetical protein
MFSDHNILLLTGEIIIRKSLEFAFVHFGVMLSVLRSDKEFDECNLDLFDIILLDPWTWAARGKKLVLFVSIACLLQYEFANKISMKYCVALLLQSIRLGAETWIGWERA